MGHVKKVGLLGGTFDPIHFGHLNLAISLLEQHGLNQVLFCPAAISPFKKDMPPLASKKDRSEMIRLSLAPYPFFELLDLELVREGPSYTIDTVQTLISTNPGTEFYLLTGEDTLEYFQLWKQWEELVALAPPLIGSRKGSLPSSHLPPIFQAGLTQIPTFEISSTVIRERLFQKKNCNHLIPALALDYIERNRLYCSLI
jgi:nicotinate-nucleotide adenylyltransferase